MLFLAAAVLWAAPPTTPPEPLRLALVLNANPIKQKVLSRHLADIKTFLDHLLRPGDEVFILTIDKAVRLVRPPTSSRAELDRAIGAATYGNPYGATLADSCQSKRKCQTPPSAAIAAAMKQFGPRRGLKVILLLGDAANPGMEADVQVFSLALPQQDNGFNEKLEQIIKQINLD